MRWRRAVPLLAGLLAAGGLVPAAHAAPVGSCALFPDDNYWHADVSDLPVDAHSAAWVQAIGLGASLKADFGSGTWDGYRIGIPFNQAPAGTHRYPVRFQWPDESDAGPYPIVSHPQIEGGGDRHLLTVDTAQCRLYELYAARRRANGTWRAGSGAIWNLSSNALRPQTWTSADAAGLPILPGLVRWNEAAAGEIDHAIRFTAPQTRDQFIWPARHQAGDPGTNLPPMGAWFRLKADVDISAFHGPVRAILEALKTHGMILADNGSPWYMSGVPNQHWNNDALHALGQLHGSDFEAVDVSSIMVGANSGAVDQP